MLRRASLLFVLPILISHSGYAKPRLKAKAAARRLPARVVKVAAPKSKVLKKAPAPAPKAEIVPAATDIVRAGEESVRGQTAQALLSMKIKKPEFTRELRIRAWNSGSEKAMVEILQPQKEEGISSLRTSSQMWNYFPNTDQTVRVPPSLMLQAWMGSDFTNDDLMKMSSLTRDYHHKLAGKEKKNGETVYKIVCTPKPGAPVVWGMVIHWARTKDFLPVEQRFFDDDGKWVRTMAFSDFKKMDDRVVPTMSKVTTAENPKQYTIVKYHRVLYDRQIDDEIFNTDALRRNSQQGKMVLAQWFTKKLYGKTVRLSSR